MSLNRIAARIAAVQALRGKTVVGDNVLDSQIAALDVQADGNLRTDQEKPFIAIYADASQSKSAMPGDWLRAMVPNGSTEFLFEAGIAATMTIVDQDTGAATIGGIPATDDNFEFQLDMTLRQIGDALTDPGNEWAEVFRAFCERITSIERIRTSAEDKTRLAAHQLKLTVDLWTDPVIGVELKPGHPLMKFFALADAMTVPNPDFGDDPDEPATIPDPVMAAKVAMMRAQLVGTEHDWQLALRRYGMVREQADALLLTTPEGAEADVLVVEIDTQPASPA